MNLLFHAEPTAQEKNFIYAFIFYMTANLFRQRGQKSPFKTDVSIKFFVAAFFYLAVLNAAVTLLISASKDVILVLK